MPLDSYANLQKSVLDWLARPADPLVAPAVPDMITLFEEEARDRLRTRFNEAIVTLTVPTGTPYVQLPFDFAELRELYVNTANGNVHLTYQTPSNMDMNLRWWGASGYPIAFTIEGLNLRMAGINSDTGAAGGSAASANITTGDTPPISPSVGWLWWDSTTGQLYIWYVDPSGSGQWVPATNQHAAPAGGLMGTTRDVTAGVQATAAAPAPPQTLTLVYTKGIFPLSDVSPTNWLLQQYPSLYLFGTLTMAEPYIGDDQRAQGWGTQREAIFNRIQTADRKARWPGSSLIIQTDVRNP